MPKVETIINGLASNDIIPREIKWIQSNNYQQMITTLGRECGKWCVGRRDLKINELIDSMVDVYTDGFLLQGQRSG